MSSNSTNFASSRQGLRPGDYVSPGLEVILPDAAFPNIVLGDRRQKHVAVPAAGDSAQLVCGFDGGVDRLCDARRSFNFVQLRAAICGAAGAGNRVLAGVVGVPSGVRGCGT